MKSARSALSVMIILLVLFTGAGWQRSMAYRPVPRMRSLNYRLGWRAQLDANADSTAVIDPNVTLENGKNATLVLVLAGNNASDCSPGDPVRKATTYAFVASTGKMVWRKSTAGRSRCTTAAPAISGAYVFSPGIDGRIHKYSAATGAEVRTGGWPVLYTRQPAVEKESSNLVVSGHFLYATTSGFDGDQGHYEGHLVTIDLNTGHATVWNSLCSGIRRLISGNPASPYYCRYRESGMFGRGQAAVDPLDGDVYLVTGNGPWNGKSNWGDSVLKLNPNGSRLLDAFTPTNQAYLDSTDSDLGSTGPAILPPIASDGRVYHLLVQGGKGPSTSRPGPAVLWLINRDRMGGKPGPGHLGGQLQHVPAPGGCQVLTAPAVWVDSRGRPLVVYADDCGVTAYTIQTSASTRPRLMTVWSIGGHFTTPVIAGDRLYLAHSGALGAYDPSTGQRRWSTSGTSAIGAVHWEYPAVSGRWVFMTDETRTLYAYVQGAGNQSP